MNGIQTADFLPGREAQQRSFKEDIQLSLTDVSVSSCDCVWLLKLGGREEQCNRVSPSKCVSLTHRMTRRHQATSRLRKTRTPAAPTTTWATRPRTATVNQAAARTTTATGLLSTGPILVAMATSCCSKPSCLTWIAPAHRTEVTKQERREEVERSLINVFLNFFLTYDTCLLCVIM